MNENRVVSLRQKDEIDDPLTEILRTGARRLITRAVEVEFDTFLASNSDLTLADGRQRVVRHGHDPVRTIQTGIGPVKVQKPKARDRGAPQAGERIRFTSSILPKWARRTKSLDALLPALYLRGISAGDFQEVLTVLLGKDAPNLSPAVIARLKGEWEDEYQRWQKRALSARRYVYVWADGVYLADGATSRMHAGTDWRDARGQERVDRFPDGHAGERAELEGIARRFEGARRFQWDSSFVNGPSDQRESRRTSAVFRDP